MAKQPDLKKLMKDLEAIRHERDRLSERLAQIDAVLSTAGKALGSGVNFAQPHRRSRRGSGSGEAGAE